MALEDNGGISGSVGVIVGILMLAGGIVSIATRNKNWQGTRYSVDCTFRTCRCIRICRIRQLQ